MRVAVVAETFDPVVNGVSNSVIRVLEHLSRTGHQALVIAPGPGASRWGDVPVVRVPSFRPPMYRSTHIGRPRTPIASVLGDFGPDVVHLASPAVLGVAGSRTAQELGIPAVAVFQTDLAAYVSRYHAGWLQPYVWRHLRRLHGRCALTLAPSSHTAWVLAQHGIGPVARWGRGVDTDRFSPRHRSAALRRALAPDGELLVGYVGRLAPEKRVHLLGPLSRVPGVRVVIVGDGPSRPALERRLGRATFLGFLRGSELSAAYASLDAFVHPGGDETFCQSVQEALASGVPVVAAASGGPLDLVQHGENGWLWPGDDPTMLREQVLSLMGDPGLYAGMRARARASVLSRTWLRVGDDLLAHYRSVLSEPPAAPAAPAVPDHPVGVGVRPADGNLPDSCALPAVLPALSPSVRAATGTASRRQRARRGPGDGRSEPAVV